MKLTINLPDDTMCMFINFVYGNQFDCMYMQSHAIQSNELFNGSIITIEAKKPKDNEK